MFDFIIPVAIFGFGGYFLYKIFELYGMRGERKTIIERLDATGLTEYVKRMPIGVGGGNKKAEACEQKKQFPARWLLRVGLLVIGFGVGVVMGNYLAMDLKFNPGNEYTYNPTTQFEAVWVACTCICTGIGLLLSFIIETIIAKMSKE
ncbi:MAG: hypothetical protein IKV12_05725 [Alistipes sp.]|nr:hypothetical protein [Alistipes sp.]